MSEDGTSDVDRPALARHPSRYGHRSPVPGRLLAAAVVVMIVVAGIAVDAAAPPPAMAPVTLAGNGTSVAPADSVSSSAFCAAGIGTGESTSVVLTNSTGRMVSGVMTALTATGTSGKVSEVHRSLSVPARGQLVVHPSTGLPAAPAATTFAFTAGGVVADQSVSGPDGWSTSPCATGTATTWSFAGGATVAGSAVALAVFNPTATEAMVNVSFVTPSGPVTPQMYQGVVVPPGRVVVENVGDYVPNASDLATVVSTQSSAVVATELENRSGGPSGLSLVLGSPQPAATWYLAQTTATPGATVQLTLANPGAVPVSATVAFGLSTGSIEPRQVEVGAQSLAVLPAGAPAGFPQQVPFSMTVEATGPLVVGRTVVASAGSAAPQWGSSLASTTVSDHWLVTGPGAPAAPAAPGASLETLAIANPLGKPVQVVVAPLGGGAPTLSLTVAANRVSVLAGGRFNGLDPLLVRSTAPVAVEADSGPSGAPGVLASNGFPLFGGGR